MSIEYNSNSKIFQQGQQNHNESLSSQVELQVRALQEQIELTIFNYESLIQLQKKNSAERSQFLLYLLQQTRQRHQKELEALQNELEEVASQKQAGQNIEEQMATIGQGVDKIVEQGRRLKEQNQNLKNHIEDLEIREKQLDDQINICQKQLDNQRLKVNDWQLTKVKWNRRKKDLLEMIGDAQKQVKGHLQSMNQEDDENEDEQMNGLFNKYKAYKQN